MKNKKIIDLFAGVGGLSLGAARAGFSVCGCVELDKHAIAAHKINFPKTVHLQKDVCALTGDELRSEFAVAEGELAGVIGGPPCQGFSHMGAKDINDSRNQLFVEFFRLVKELSPDFFLAENVPGIIHPKNAKFVGNALKLVEEGYTILPPMKFSANEFGAPTTRTRVFFIGYKTGKLKDLLSEDFTPSKKTSIVTVGSALKGLPMDIDPSWRGDSAWCHVDYFEDDYFHSRIKGIIPRGIGDPNAIKKLKEEQLVSGFIGTHHSESVALRYAKVKPGAVDKISKSPRLKLNGFCPTLRAGTGPEHGSFQAVRPLHPIKNRVITPREAARLQGFPDWFQFAPTKWHSFRQIGNSVSPILSEYILSTIHKHIIERPIVK